MISRDSLIISCLVGSIVTLGVALTTLTSRRKRQKALQIRLSSLLQMVQPKVPKIGQSTSTSASTSATTPAWITELLDGLPKGHRLTFLIERAGFQISALSFLSLALTLFLLPPLVAFALEMPVEIALIVGAVLAAVPFFVLAFLAEKEREKFTEQLPDAIRLMISVLKSGLSVLQAVKSVADEIPAPCGREFTEIMHRLNLGQPLPEALLYSVERYSSFELDLVRRATALQLEVGGSLAELFDKTNQTLIERIKLKKHVRVLTAQSRLSGVIIALMPFIVAVTFESLHPGYLRPLFETNLGKILLGTALFLQIIGIISIRNLSTIKV